MKKRIGRLLLLLALCLSLLPTTAWAAGKTVTYIDDGGTRNSSATFQTEPSTGGTGITLPAQNALTKSGYTLVGWSDGTKGYLPGATYEVKGNDTLTALWTANNADNPLNVAIAGKNLSGGNYYHNGSSGAAGTVNSTAAGASAMYVDGVLVLSGLNVNCAVKGIKWEYNDLVVVLLPNSTNTVSNTADTAIGGELGGGLSTPDLIVRGTGTLDVTGKTYGIWAWKDITFEDGAQVTVTAQDNSGVLNNASGGEIAVKSGAGLTACGKEYGIGTDHTSKGRLSVASDASFTAKGESGALRNIENDKVNFNGKTIYVGGNTAGTGLSTWNSSAALTDYKFISTTGEVHVHNWSYSLSADKATINRTCTPGCPDPSGYATLGVSATMTYENREADIWLSNTDFGVSSTQLYPKIFFKSGDTVLGGWRNAPRNVGTYTACLTYEGVTAEVTYTITPRTVTVDSTNITLSGDASYKAGGVTRNVTVKDDLGNFINRDEYTVSYTNNTAVGTATVNITDKEGGNYIVNGSTTFEITKATAELTVAPVNVTYDGAALEIGAGKEVPYSANTPGTLSWKNTAPKDVTDNSVHTLVFTPDDTTNYNPSEVDVNVTITPAPLSISGMSGETRDYVPNDKSVTLTGGTLTGVFAGDTVGFDRGTGTMDDANAGEGKAVTTAITLTGADRDNYTLTQPTDVTVTIRKITPSVTNARAAVTYGGSVADSDITAATGVTGSFHWKDVSSYGDASNTPKTFYARFVPTDSVNYETLESVAVSVTVAKAAYTGSAIKSDVRVFVGQTKNGVTVDLTELIRAIAGAEVNDAATDSTTDPYGLVRNVAVLADNCVRFDLIGGNVAARQGTIKVNIASTNYQDITAQIVVTSVAKPVPSLTLTPESTSLTGGGTVALTVSGLPEGASCAVTCDSAAAAITGSGSAWSATLPNVTANYTFTVTSAETDSYAGATANCTVAVTRRSNGGGSSPSYPIMAANSANGSVAISPNNASKGSTVTITVTPDKGYDLETLTVLDRNGKELQLLSKGDGKYTFTMPTGNVTIRATFAEDNSVLNFFVDVTADDYYYDAVLWAAENGITAGVSETAFGPHLSCARAQLVTFLWRAVGSPVVDYAMDFADVDETAYCGEAIRWAASLGIVSGYGNGLFGSDDTITREQMAVILYRFAKTMGMDTTQGGMAVREFADYASISDYAVEAVQWAVNAGIMQGYNNNLMPGQPCTRAQIVTMLHRLLGK